MLRNLLFTLFCFLLCVLNSIAGNNNYPIGARSAGMAHATVALSDTWSGYHNQAGLARINTLSSGVFYENRYQIKELSLKAGTFVLPTKSGNFGLCYTQFGFELFKETKVGINFSKSLGERFWAGIQLDYFKMKLADIYGGKSTYSFEAGVLTELYSNLFLGFHIFNPTQASFSSTDFKESLPTLARLGLAWYMSENLIISFETEKGLKDDLRVRTGVEYQFIDNIHLRGGVSSNPGVISLGVGYSFKLVKADIAFSRHPVLGYSPSISLNLAL